MATVPSNGCLSILDDHFIGVLGATMVLVSMTPVDIGLLSLLPGCFLKWNYAQITNL